MAFKSIELDNNTKTFNDIFKFDGEGAMIEGVYTDVHTTDFNGKAERTYKMYTIKLADGKEVDIKGLAEIDKKMEKVELNSNVRITYTGETPTKNGFKIKNFKVEVAE